LESLVFHYKIVFEQIEKIVQKKMNRLNIIGGGIQNKLLCQLTSDALNIEVLAGPIEGATVGNVGVQAIENKVVRNLAEWREIVQKSFPIEKYVPKNPKYFEENMSKFLEIYNNQ